MTNTTNRVLNIVFQLAALMVIGLPTVAEADHGGATHYNWGLAVPTTSSTGNYTVTFNSGGYYLTLQEKTNGGLYSTITSTMSGSHSFTNKPDGTYTYRVYFSYCYYGCYYYYSEPQSIVVSTGLPAPGSISGPATDDDGAFSLTWNGVSGATYYTIQRQVDGSGTWDFAYDVITPGYDESGLASGTYNYRVQACDSGNNCSSFSPTKSVVVTIVGPPPPPPPVPGTSGDPGIPLASDETGTTSGSFRVDESGAATYSVPIVTAPGTAGVAPELSLNYSSGGGNGIAGMGWSLGGLSAITRCKQTYDQDRNPQPIAWSSTDRYCLDGQRLLLENPAQTYGAQNTTYRAEVDNGAIVTIRGSVSGEPDYFEVKRKDGSTTYYGKSPNDLSNVSAKSGGGNGRTFVWGIRHFRDNIGNPIWFDYYNDAFGQRIKTIYWAFGLGRGPAAGHGARVEFHYVDRGDDRVGYVAGVALTTKKRLSQIKSYNVIGGATLIRQYNLAYNEGITASDNVSRLTSIEECAGGACLPKTTFTWRVPRATAALVQQSTRTLAESSNLSDLTLADINGDGLMDLVWFEGAPANAVLNYAISNGTSLTQRPFSGGAMEYNPVGSGEKLTPIDYNLDGRYDIAYWDDNASRWRIVISEPQSDGTWRLRNAAYLTPIDHEDAMFVDIDSNGTTDAVWATGSGTWSKQLRRSLLIKSPTQPVTSSTYYYFATPENVGSPSTYTVGKLHGVAADFDGDGRIGLVFGRDVPECEYEFSPPRCFGNGYASLLNIVNPTSATPTYSQYAHLNAQPTMPSDQHAKVSGIVVTDINADGLSDLWYPVWRDPNVDINRFQLAINKGNGTFDVRNYYNTTIKSSGARQAQFVDWNGDHHPDLVWKDTSGSGSVKIQYWDPSFNNFGSTQTLTWSVSTSTNESVYFPDMNGDGVPDMLKIDTSSGRGNVTLYTRKLGTAVANRAANRIEKITNGIGAQTSIVYEPLSYSDHYERMVVDTTPEPTGGVRLHCIDRESPEPICVNSPVTAASADDFYAKINGDWELPGGAVGLTKTSPVIEVAGPMYVVTDVVGSSPSATPATPGTVTASATSALEYHYYEAKVQAAGRGFLGFQQLQTVDTIANVTTTSQYRQDWPFTGLPIGTVVSSGAGHAIGGGSTDWEILEWTSSMPGTATTSGTAALGPIHVEQTRNTNNVYDLVNNGSAAGALLSTTTTATQFDAEANAEVITATTTNHLTQKVDLVVTTTNVFEDQNSSPFTRWQGRLKSTTVVTDRAPVQGGITRHSTFQYYTTGTYKGMLQSEVIEPGHPDFELTTTRYYDAHGNLAKSTVSGGGETRCNAPAAMSVYDTSGRYVDRTYDCLGRLTTVVVTRNGFGKPTRVDTVLDALVTSSRLTTNVYYGRMGREYYRTAEDGSFKTTYFSPDTTNCPASTAFKATFYVAGGGTSEVCYDMLARETRKLTLGFDGEWDAQDTNYDNKGRTLHTSEPYDLASGALYWTSMEYDLLDRVTLTTRPDGTWTRATYSGFDLTTTISYQGQTRTEKRNALGDITQATDNLGASTWFFYDDLGYLRVTLDAGGNLTSSIFNELGQKVSLKLPSSNPSNTEWVYEYNHFGELVKETSPNGHTSEMTYDGLGRLKTRIDKINGVSPEGSTTWTYDTSPNGLGKLDHVSDWMSGYGKAVMYDALGRVDEVVTSFDAGTYFEKTTYDQFGRVYQVFDAAGNGSFTDHGIQNQYGYYGHLSGIADAVEIAGAPRTIYRRITSMNARGQVTDEELGIGASGAPAVTATYQFEPDTGRLAAIDAVNASGLRVQDLDYVWNDVGSLTSRNDTYHGLGGPNTLSETFGYDGLNRLTSHGEAGQAALTVTYDAIGNILTKTGISGTYGYGSNAPPTAVTSANGSSYTYDLNGNNLTGGGRSIAYSTFDKPTSISKGGNTVSFAYDVDRSRYRRIDQGSNSATTRYIGNVEIISRQNGRSERKRYIAGVAIETGFYTNGNETSRETIYTLKDHLGSLDVILDDSGDVLQKLSFGPWGQRRDASNWKEVNSTPAIIDLGPTFDVSKTTRGFTGHEMVDTVGIIHMNGRIYDPFLGRFLQADNYVQDPVNTQSHNRYSYVWNNPLNATDPSGEFVFSLLAIAIIAVEKITIAWVIGVVVGAAATLDALIAGADLSDAFLTGIISGVSAGAFAKVGSTWFKKLADGFDAGLYTAKIAVHGAIGGITSVLQGGKFGHGFASAGLTAAATFWNNSRYIHKNSNGFSWRRVAIGATIGGTASKLSGGKFGNGAMTGAFSQALNHEGHEEQRQQRIDDLPPEYREMIEALQKDEDFAQTFREARNKAQGLINRQIEFDGFEVDRTSQRPAGARIDRGIFVDYKVTDVGEYVLNGGTTHGTSNIVGGRPWQPMLTSRRPAAIVGVFPGAFYPSVDNMTSLSLMWSVPVPVITFSSHGAQLFMGSYGPIPYSD